MLAGHCGRQTGIPLSSVVITDYIRKAQDKSIGGEGSRGLLPELEALDREWSQGGRQASNDRGHNESKKSRHGNWEQTSVSRWKDSPDPLPDTDVVMHPDRIDKFESVTPGRGFVRVIADSVRTMEKYGGVSIEIGEGLATCTVMDHVWTITSMM